ncbi:uncharacterized protein PG986_012691 [Apiospora aurea]|uniref:Uncharacterized protein n=1 Tax=Apiospora aurea TaxID=335848 RepID=A0ABR1Q0P7_9PEZI
MAKRVRGPRNAPAAAGKRHTTNPHLKRPANCISTDVDDGDSAGNQANTTTQYQPDDDADSDDTTDDGWYNAYDDTSGEDEEEVEQYFDNLLELVSEKDYIPECVVGYGESSLCDELHPRFQNTSQLYFKDAEDWGKNWETAKRRAGKKKVWFGPGFRIQERSPSPPLTSARTIVSIQCGDTLAGYGRGLSDSGLLAVAKALSGLQNAELESCTRITDRGLLALLRRCPDVRSVGVTGHDRGLGRITDQTVSSLTSDEKLGPRLRHLRLVDQRRGSKRARELLSYTRPRLEFVEGYGAGMVAYRSRSRGRGITRWKGGRDGRRRVRLVWWVMVVVSVGFPSSPRTKGTGSGV